MKMIPHNKKSWYALLAFLTLSGCGIRVPKEKHTSFDTLTVTNQEVMYPARYNATLEGNMGGNTFALRIWMKPDVMAAYKLMPEDLFAAVGTQSLVAPVGSLGKMSENTYYVQQEDLSNFFPKLALDGSIAAAGVIGNPVGMVYSAIASLAQPLFSQGRIRGNYKSAQKRQEQALINLYIALGGAVQ